MGAFPRLKTGAVAQYPASRSVEYATRVFRFLEGSEQRYRERGSAVRRWVIRLDKLDEAELQTLQEFFGSVQGRAGSFSFVDPWDEAEHENCSLEDDTMAVELSGEMRGRTVLVVRENRV
jgi:uncharacterized membrane-anchored protein